MNALANVLHIIAASLWIGGLFFALVILRPTTASLEPARRLLIWAGVFKRFFPWVWMAVLILPVTGYWLLFRVFGGLANAPSYIHVMHLLGLVMIGVFVFLYYRIYPKFKVAIQGEDWPSAGAALNKIRLFVIVNFCLGLLLFAAVAGMQHISS